MRSKLLRWTVAGLVVAAFVGAGGLDTVRDVAALFFGTPHERYAARLRRGWGPDDPSAPLWLSSAARALHEGRRIEVPWWDELWFSAHRPEARAFVLPARRGQRLVADAVVVAPRDAALFLDLFLRDGEALRHVGSAARDERRLALEIRADGEYVLRAQSELGRDVLISLVQRAEPSLRLPVEGVTAAHIRSSFGDPRDGGRREHEGIDIFARRGTNVLAAADGLVSSVGTNRLGGKVVWIARPSRGEAHYYAHLETQLVGAGTRVNAGDVIGTVGNTGNARGTAPHLHFGIYGALGAVDPLPYVALPRAAPPSAARAAARAGSRSDRRPATGG